MQTYHAEATVNDEGKVILSLPFPHGQKVDIVVRPSESIREEDEAWGKLAQENFLAGYSEEDAVYDNYHQWRNDTDSAK